MVMRQMRANTKWIMLVTALAFVALMVFEWGMDISGRSAGTLGELGRVDGSPVPYEQWVIIRQNLYDQVQSSQEEPVTSQQNKEIEEAAWDQLVNQILIQNELRRRGIVVTDEEVRQAARFNPPPEFRSNPAFQTEGQFDLQKYQAFLADPSLDNTLLLQLEAYYRDGLTQQKLYQQVTSGIYVPDAELWQAWQDANEQVQVRFLVVNPSQLVPDDEVPVTPDEIEAYYDANREEFATPATATVKIAVLQKAPLAADTAAALERARSIREEILGGTDFAEVAARDSDDQGTAADGGDLGMFGRGQMVGPFDSAAFNAPIGEITEPVQSAFGFHVIEVLNRTADSAQARHVLVRIDRTDDSEIALLTMADSLEALGESLPLEAAAEALGLSAQEVQVTETFPFVPGPGQVGEGADWALEEAEPGEVSPVFENAQAFYAMELVSMEPAGYLPLDQATTAIEQTLRQQKKMSRALDEAQSLADRARAGEDLEAMSTETGHDLRLSELFARNDFVAGLGRQNAAIGTSFGLERGQISDAVEAVNNVVVLQLIQRASADSMAFEAQKEDQRVALQTMVEQRRVQEWLEGLREQASIIDRRDVVLQPADETATMPLVF
jgi:peptidyl-prolyl cis-trans isomerase D